MGSLEGRVMLVAGVGSGLGAAVVAALAGEGASVFGVARQGTQLHRLETHARERGWRFRGLTADLLDASQVEAVVREVNREGGKLDAVVVTAGRWIPGPTLLHELSPAQWSEAFQHNLEPIYQVLRHAIPTMMKQGSGSVVLVAAGESVRTAGSVSYAAAKAAIVELVRKLAADYRSAGIRVNAVLPGNMGRDAPFDPPSASSIVALQDSVATAPWEVAKAIRYLVSAESPWVTGTTIVVDGGASTRGAPP